MLPGADPVVASQTILFPFNALLLSTFNPIDGQDHFHGRVLPARKPVAVYLNTADTGYPGWYIDHSGEMGENA
jgi:hypothetical protein